MMKSDKEKPAKSRARGEWIDELYNAVGRTCRLETADGVTRAGRMSGLRTKEISYNGGIQEIVTEVELNNDPTDTVPIVTLVRLDID